jgi:bifunctional ADP-heptose synthase (sugar kinase/adenylyltransferase)
MENRSLSMENGQFLLKTTSLSAKIASGLTDALTSATMVSTHTTHVHLPSPHPHLTWMQSGLIEVGHAGAMLQARRLGKELLVGIHSDEEILENKGPTVMTLIERSVALKRRIMFKLC